MIRVGMIGFGAIGSAIVAGWSGIADTHRLTDLCVRPDQVCAAKATAPAGARVWDNTADFLVRKVDLAIEAAGHRALEEMGAILLARGTSLYALSIGALADDRLRARLASAAILGGARLLLPPGALAGFDGLRTLRQVGLVSVAYTSAKPPVAWRGTAVETLVDLSALTERTVLFRGDARAAATRFPKNANLAAAVALAGVGFERTTVELIADPALRRNTSRIEARSATAALSLTLESDGSDANPKSSTTVSASVLASLANATSAFSFA